MELKDFIKGTIKDIAEAVSELNGEMESSGLKVNPARGNHVDNTIYDEDNHVVHTIDFDLQVTASEKNGVNGGISVSLLRRVPAVK